MCRAAIKIHVRTFVFVVCLSVVCLSVTFVTLSIRSDRDLPIIDIIRSEVITFRNVSNVIVFLYGLKHFEPQKTLRGHLPCGCKLVYEDGPSDKKRE